MTLQVGGDVTEHSQASRSALFNALVEALKRDRKVGTITIQSEKCIRIPSKYNQILLNTIRILHQMASSTINYYQQRKQGKGSERWDDWMSAASVSSCSCFASGHTAASGSSHCGETRHKEKGLVQRFWNFEWEWNGHEWINNWMPLQPRGWNFLCCYRCKLYLFWLFWFLNILNQATSEQQHAQCLRRHPPILVSSIFPGASHHDGGRTQETGASPLQAGGDSSKKVVSQWDWGEPSRFVNQVQLSNLEISPSWWELGGKKIINS